jgi:hypothetical protein
MSRNRCDTQCQCGMNLSYRPELRRRDFSELMRGADYLKAIGWEDCPYRGGMDWTHQNQPLMYAKVICPLCLVEYVGWYHPPTMPQYDGPAWELFDTSYWSAYNDEPGDTDEKNKRDVEAILKELNRKTSERRTDA